MQVTPEGIWQVLSQASSSSMLTESSEEEVEAERESEEEEAERSSQWAMNLGMKEY